MNVLDQYKEITTIPVKFEKVEEEVKNTNNVFQKVKIWLMHLDDNQNKSFFSKKVVKDALPTLANVPILGYIEENTDGNEDFSDHRSVLVRKNGQWTIKKITSAYGVIPENNDAKFEKMTGKDGVEREYLVVEGLIWKRFDDVIEIIENDDGTKDQSMEIDQNSYEGFVDSKDKLFHFTKFEFAGAVILGKDFQPAMHEAKVELVYSKEDIEKEIDKKMKEYKLITSYSASKEVNNDLDNNKEGGNVVDEKLKLLETFGYSKEKMDELKINLEEFSLEDLKVKLEELKILDNTSSDNTRSEKLQIITEYGYTQEQIVERKVNFEEISIEDLKVKLDEFKAADFALTNNQKREQISAALNPKSDPDMWMPRDFWLVDYDDEFVYAEDSKQNYRHVRMSYSMNGDNAVINFDSKELIKWVPVPLEGSVEVDMTLVSVGRLEYEKESVVKNTKDEITGYKAKIKDVEDQFSAVNEELRGLREFKAQSDQKELEVKIEALFSKFDKLGEDEVKVLRESVVKNEVDLESAEKELFAMLGKKVTENPTEFSKGKDKSKGLEKSIIYDGVELVKFNRGWEHLVS